MKKLFAPLLSLGALASPTAFSQCLALDSGNQTPFAAIHLQPASFAQTSCNGAISARYSVSNNFVLDNQGNESLEIDGEVSRFEMSFHKQLTQIALIDSVSVTLPFYQHGPGNLDDLIDDWHDLTGLPGGDRDQRQNDQINYRYSNNGQTLVDITEEQNGVGDITLAAHKDRYSVALKLPTGDEDKLTGSGGAEIGFAYSKPLPEAGFSGVTGAVGATYIFDDKVLKAQSNSVTASLALAAAYALGNRVNAYISGSWQSAWYDSDTDALGSASGNIGFGLYGETAKGFWAIRLTEDVPVETAPDFGISLDYSFKL